MVLRAAMFVVEQFGQRLIFLLPGHWSMLATVEHR